jgi:hypothetical protein
MISYTLYNSVTGMIFQSGSALTEFNIFQLASVLECETYFGEAITDPNKFIDPVTLEVKNRPICAIPATRTIGTDETWAIAGVPNHTDVRVDGIIVGTCGVGVSCDLLWEYPGTYELNLEPPEPWRHSKCMVTVE